MGGGWLKHGRADMKGIQVRADGSRSGDSNGDGMCVCVYECKYGCGMTRVKVVEISSHFYFQLQAFFPSLISRK